MSALKKTGKPKARQQLLFRWLAGLAVVLAAVWIFAELAEDVWTRESFVWDVPVILAIHNFRSPLLDVVMLVVTQFGQLGAILAALAAAVYFARSKNWLDASAVLFSLGGGVAINSFLKLLFLRPRPSLFIPLTDVTGFSFPSGHVAAAGAVFGFLAVILWRKRKRLWAAVSVGLILAVALSRIYLGAHYPSDTVSALAFCFLWLVILFFVRDRYERQFGHKL